MTNRELDKLIAQHVMGWDVHYRLPFGERPSHEGIEHFRDHVNNTIYLPGQWTPSESEEAAFEVVRKMRNDGFCFKLWQPGLFPDSHPTFKPESTVSFICGLGPCKKHGNKLENHHGAYDVKSETFPLAICRAALVAMDVFLHPVT